jgi:catechol 2,3-dioxygenase-like lactoylglutathione lyase family enzyme
MELSINAVTLAVGDLGRSKAFYGEGLGYAIEQDQPQFVSFRLADGSSALSLYPRKALAHDAGVDAEGTGFRGVTFSMFVGDPAGVDELLREAERAGGTIVRPGKAAQWGGYFGYFADPDNHLWKVVAP